MKGHLVLFAKAPRLGAVKRRLAAGIGMVPAWCFYRRMLASMLRRLGSDQRWTCWLALTPDRAVFRPSPQGWCKRNQGGGDLGQRMGRALRALPPGPVVIVGGDIPDLQRRHVEQAFRALGSADVVFGPACDGGYWLVGARRRPSILPTLFMNVRWSSWHALADTLANAGHRRVFMLENLEDVDDADSYRRVVTTRPL